MDLVISLGQMVQFIKVILFKIILKVLDYINGMIKEHITAPG
jgi:hypothetical protein